MSKNKLEMFYNFFAFILVILFFFGPGLTGVFIFDYFFFYSYSEINPTKSGQVIVVDETHDVELFFEPNFEYTDENLSQNITVLTDDENLNCFIVVENNLGKNPTEYVGKCSGMSITLNKNDVIKFDEVSADAKLNLFLPYVFEDIKLRAQYDPETVNQTEWLIFGSIFLTQFSLISLFLVIYSMILKKNQNKTDL